MAKDKSAWKRKSYPTRMMLRVCTLGSDWVCSTRGGMWPNQRSMQTERTLWMSSVCCVALGQVHGEPCVKEQDGKWERGQEAVSDTVSQ